MADQIGKGSRLSQWGHPALLILLLGIFVIQPWATYSVSRDVLVTGLYGAVLLVCLAVVSEDRRLVAIAVVVLIPALILGEGGRASVTTQIAGNVARSTFLCIVIGSMLRHIFGRRRVTPNVLMGALSVFLLVGVLWQLLYQTADLVFPDAFAGLSGEPGVRLTQLFYFSFVTLTTLGYGDITPTRPETMSLVTVEAVVGQAYLVVVVAYLVARLVSERGVER